MSLEALNKQRELSGFLRTDESCFSLAWPACIVAFICFAGSAYWTYHTLLSHSLSDMTGVFVLGSLAEVSLLAFFYGIARDKKYVYAAAITALVALSLIFANCAFFSYLRTMPAIETAIFSSLSLILLCIHVPRFIISSQREVKATIKN